MKLNIPALHKTIKVNQKKVKIPKLGIKHYKLLSDLKQKDSVKMIKKLVQTIHPDLTSSETELVLLHLLAFNKIIPEVTDVDGFLFDINKAYLSNETKFQLNGKTYKFRQPKYGETFEGYIDVLNTLSKDGIDYSDMPAVVLTWVKKLTSTITIDIPDAKVTGIHNILGIGNS